MLNIAEAWRIVAHCGASRRGPRRAGLAACCLALLAAAPATRPATVPAAATFTVTVPGVGPPEVWAAAGLSARFADGVTSVGYDTHGRHHTAHAVPLLAVLERAGLVTALKMDPKADPPTKNYPLRLAVVVKGRDGYTATFALAELLPDIGDRPVWLAVDADDKPLADRSAPVELIAPADAKPGRWVRGVASVTVVDPSE